MKYSRILIVFIVLWITFGLSSPEQVMGDESFLIHLPAISRNYPEQRLGPFIAKVTAVAADPKQAGVIYAGTWGNGVFKSSDHGATWMPVNQGLTNLTIQSLAVDPGNSQNVYAGAYYDASTENGVFKSNDGGMTWKNTGSIENTYNGVLVKRPIIYSLVVDPSNSNILYAGTRMSNLVPGQAIYGGGGVFKTINQGQSWLPVNRNLPSNDLYVYDLAINPKNPSLIYAALHVSGAFISSDGGNHWKSLTNGTLVDNSGRAILVDSGNPAEIYYGTWHNQGIYYSNDQGGDWWQKGIVGMGGVLGLAQDPNNHLDMLANVWQKSSNDPPSRLYFSSDQGDSWKGNDGGAYYQVAFDPFDGSIIYGGTDNGVKISSNKGSSWGLSNWGLEGYSTTAVVANPVSQKILYAAIHNLGVATSIDQGASWTFVNSGLPSYFSARSLAIDPIHPDVIFATSDNAGVYRTANGGATWSAIAGSYPSDVVSNAVSDPFNNQLFVAPEIFGPVDPSIQSATATSVPGYTIAVAPDSSTVLVGTGGYGVLQYNGVSGWLASSLTSGTVHAILFDASVPGRVLAGAAAADGSLYISENKGATWAKSAIGLDGRTVYAISQSPDKPEIFWAGTDAGVFRSEDKGASWAQSCLADMLVTTLNAHPSAAGTLMAGTPDAIYMSRDYGLSWEKEYSQLDQYGIQDIRQDPSDPDFVYIATRFAGIIRLDR